MVVDTGYCLSCLRDHLHKARGVLREAVKQWHREGEPTESVRRKVELAEEELSSAETEHVWNVHLEDEDEHRRLKEIGGKISKIRKGLESTQIGFPHPGIAVKGGLEDLEKAIDHLDSALGDVYESLTKCRTCRPMQEALKQLETYTKSLEPAASPKPLNPGYSPVGFADFLFPLSVLFASALITGYFMSRKRA